MLNVPSLCGLSLAELSNHCLFTSVLLDVVCSVVNVGGGVGINLVYIDVIHTNRLEKSLQDVLPVLPLDVGAVGSILQEVHGKIAGLDGEHELDVHLILVVKIAVTNVEVLEKAIKTLREVPIGNG